MSSVLLSNQSCIDPKAVYQTCVRLGLPTDFWGRPNSFTNVRGCKSGTGFVLLTSASLEVLDLEDEQTLAFSLAPSEIAGLVVTKPQTVTQAALHVVDCTCITSGLRGDPAACYLVELADRRRLARGAVIDSAYNILSTPGDDSEYFSATTDPDTEDAWTWDDMLADVWSNLEDWLGDYPGLPLDDNGDPLEPDGVPTNFDFYGHGLAIDALQFILDRLGYTLVMDNAGDFTIVQLGADDEEAVAAIKAADTLRIWDDDAQTPNLGRVPATIRVQFPIQQSPPDPTGDSPWYTIDIDVNVDDEEADEEEEEDDEEEDDDSEEEGGYEGIVVVNDDLPAVFEDDALLNETELESRAAERAANYLLAVNADPLHRFYGLPLASLTPGSLIESVRVGDRGRGMVTEIVNRPCPPPSPLPVAPNLDDGADVERVRILCATPGAFGYPGLVLFVNTDVYPVTYSDNGATTTIHDSIVDTGAQSVTPASMDGIAIGGSYMLVGGDCKTEVITVTGTDATAEGIAVASDEEVTSVTVTQGGFGYTSVPDVTFSGGGGEGAKGTAVVVGGVVTDVTIDDPGSGYTSAPTVTFGISQGTPTMFTADFASVIASFPVIGVTMTNLGSGYAASGIPPTVSFTGGGGTAAAGTAILDSETGDTVESVEITDGGQDYTSEPTVVFDNTGTSGTGAAGTAVVGPAITIYFGGIWVAFNPGPDVFTPMETDVTLPTRYLATKEAYAPDGFQSWLAEGGITTPIECDDGSSAVIYAGRIQSIVPADD